MFCVEITIFFVLRHGESTFIDLYTQTLGGYIEYNGQVFIVLNIPTKCLCMFKVGLLNTPTQCLCMFKVLNIPT